MKTMEYSIIDIKISMFNDHKERDKKDKTN